MISSKKGIESFPFFLFLSLLIAAFVVVIGFYQLQTLSSFSADKTLTDSYGNLINSMETLKATTDYGSFSNVELEIPAGYKITISAENDTIRIENGKDLVNKLDFDIQSLTDKYKTPLKNTTILNSGTYNLVIYYGNPTNETEPYEIFFI